MNHQNVIMRTTNSPLETVCQRLADVSQQHKFGVLGVHDLKEKLNSKGVPFARECRVYEVCNPQQAQRVLDQAIAVSTALPCRISVYQEDGRTVLAMLKPTALLALFGMPDAFDVAREVEESMTQIMVEACREPTLLPPAPVTP